MESHWHKLVFVLQIRLVVESHWFEPMRHAALYVNAVSKMPKIILCKSSKINILRQRFDEFKNVPAGHTQVDIFHIFGFIQVQVPVQVKPRDELHWYEPLTHVEP